MTEELPEDLRRWRALGEDQPFAEHGVRFLADDEPASVFDTSYLTDADRADPNIAANVAAIADTAALITWVAESEDGEVFGYWRGPSDTPLEQAPVVQYDTEGQFSTMPGRTFTEALCWYLGDGEPELWSELVEAAAAEGIEVRAGSPREVPSPVLDLAPSDHHDERYRVHGGSA